MGVSENIVKLRTLTNTTQQQLADIAGVSRSAVSLWEIGKAEPRMGPSSRWLTTSASVRTTLRTWLARTCATCLYLRLFMR
jgi:transcriptional regulator with XRE-family HTH domain